MKRKLPLLVERTLGDIQMNVVEMGSSFEQKVHDAMIDTKLSITCSAGCSNCCHHPFQVSVFQGIIIFRWLAERGKWTPALRAKVLEASERTLTLAQDIWLASVIPCPLLNDKQRCTAYDVRPLRCRVTFSMTSPDFCHPHELDRARLIPRHEVVARFHERERTFFKRHGLRGYYIPLSTALILAEKIHAGEIDLDDADNELGRMVSENR